MKFFSRRNIAGLAISLTHLASAVPGAASAERIVLENADCRLEFSSDGTAQSLLHKATGQECLAAGVRMAGFTLTQHLPYLPEQQLARPARTIVYPVVSLRRGFGRDRDRLIADFGEADFEAHIRLRITDAYIGFTLEKVVYKNSPKLRSVYPPAWDEVAFLRLPIRLRENYGPWLNVAWDDAVAVNLLATDPYAKIDGDHEYNWRIFSAAVVPEVQSENVGAALVTTTPARLLDCIAQVEEDYNLPRGVESRRRPEYGYSYYAVNQATPQTIDRHIAYAKRAGFRTMQVYYQTFAKGVGHFEFRPEYPNGMADLKEMGERLRRAGMIPGFHIHYNKASKTDAYVRNVDRRLNAISSLTLEAALSPNATSIVLDQHPRGLTYEEGRRLLRIGSELVEWTGHTTEPPYQFTGCKRGVLGTRAAAHAPGTRVDVLDVDTWPMYVRFDQHTSIQEEVAARIQQLYSELGARFVYFDGAEDVHPPYWFFVSWSQWQVYRRLEPKPLFTAGASSAHFSWHMLSRGNGFDKFTPENLKAAVRQHHFEKARLNAQDFSSMDWGWTGYASPSSRTMGTQPDMLEYAASLASGFDGVLSLMPDLAALDAHPRTADNLEVLRRWEEFRISGRITTEQKARLRDPGQEHHLLINEADEFEIVTCTHIPEAAGGSAELRAFVFERAGRNHVVYWHPSGAGRLQLTLPVAQVRLMERIGKALPVENHADGVLLPLDRRRYIDAGDMAREEIVAAMQKARVMRAP